MLLSAVDGFEGGNDLILRVVAGYFQSLALCMFKQFCLLHALAPGLAPSRRPWFLVFGFLVLGFLVLGFLVLDRLFLDRNFFQVSFIQFGKLFLDGGRGLRFERFR